MLPAPLLSAPNAMPLNLEGFCYRQELLKKHHKSANEPVILPHFTKNIEVGPHILRISNDENTLHLAKEVFYREHLLSEQAKTQTFALIVPYEELDKLHQRFPNIDVRYFECSTDFYFASVGWHQLGPRIRRDLVIDTCNDAELWDTTTSAIILEQFTVDVIIYQSDPSTASHIVMEQLAECRWEDNPEYNYDKSIPIYRRRQDAPIDSPNFIVSPMYSAVTHRLPLVGGGKDATVLDEMAKEVQEVINRLQAVANGCGWFTGTPTVTILNFHTDVIKSNILWNVRGYV